MTSNADRAAPGRWRAVATEAAVPVAAIGLALVLGAVAIAVAGADPIGSYGALVGGAVGGPTALAATLLRSLPIVLAGIGMGLAFRAGAFNLGGEGQMIVGALAAAVVAGWTGTATPAPLGLLAGIGAGMAAGAAWALVPALLQVRLDLPILITSLLLNYVGSLLAAYAVSYPLRDLSGGAALAQTAMVPEAARVPVLPDTRLHLGLVLIVLLPLAVGWLLRRTVLGYELRMTGLNPQFAEYGGVRTGRVTLLVMLASGAICGLGGSLLVLGVSYRYTDTMITSAGYAWSGFIAAVLTLANPLLTAVAGAFLGALQVGAAGMARATQVPLQLVDVVQATIIIVVAVRPGLRAFLRRRLGGRG